MRRLAYPQSPDRVAAVIADVRGTLIHPYCDTALAARLAAVICDLLEAGCLFCFNTAGSMEGTMEQLVLPRLQEEAMRRREPGRLFANLSAYVDSSTQCFLFGRSGSPYPAPGLRRLRFRKQELRSVLRAVADATARNGLRRSTFKVKPGQVNFYCGGTLDARLALAAGFGLALPAGAARPVRVMVPAAKNTIDIALCDKSRGVADFLRRTRLAAEQVLILGDSLFENGPDWDMLAAAAGASAAHVGSTPAPPGVGHVRPRGTAGAYLVLNRVAAARS